MDKKKLDNIVKQIKNLEDECQKGNNVKSNMDIMNDLLDQLTLEEIFEVAMTLESILPNIEK